MKYEDALEFIHGATRVGSRDFSRIGRMLEIIGNPQKKLRFVHVAGTNGKGSTATMTANVLINSGYKTGLFVSPYVVDFRERIQLDGRLIPKEELAAAVERLIPSFEQTKREVGECTEFEVVTAIALWYYAQKGCDIVVLEAGIGGLTDKTNVIDAPEVAVITSVSFDHTNILGDTLAEIAGQKSGIIKPGCSVALYGALPEEAKAVLLEKCRQTGITPNIPDLSRLEIERMDGSGSDIVYKSNRYHIPLVGRHQVLNALTVISVCEELEKKGYNIGYPNVRDAIAATSFVGRCETVREKPLCIIDGAHNIDGARALCGVIDEVMGDRRVTVVMGMLEDKDYEPSISMVAARADRFIAVRPDSFRSLDPERTAEIARRFCKDVAVIEKPSEGAEYAVGTAREDEVIIACGSLYMIGEVKEALSK